jgi:hypothetical protein
MKAGVTFPVCLLLDKPIIRSPAPAGLRVAASQKFSYNNDFLTAGALTAPQSSFVSTADLLNCSQSTERLACDINGLGHGGL